MADEITIALSVKVANGLYAFSKSYSNKKANQTTGGGGGPGTTNIGTSEETLDMTGYSYVLLQNLDSTNYVQVGFATGVYNIRLRPSGPPLLVELEAATTLYLKANSAACEIDVIGQYT